MDRFKLGKRCEHGESLALASHLLYTRRQGGGRGWGHCTPFPPPEAAEANRAGVHPSWPEASEAIKAAYNAMHHQWRMEMPAPAPTRPRPWIPTGVSP